MGQQPVNECPAVVPSRRVYHESGGLIHHHYMMILIEDIQRQVLGTPLDPVLRLGIQIKLVIDHNLVARPRGEPIS
jgi:hypothetical protein